MRRVPFIIPAPHVRKLRHRDANFLFKVTCLISSGVDIHPGQTSSGTCVLTSRRTVLSKLWTPEETPKMESYSFTPNLLSSREDLRERLPDFVIQSLNCLEMLPLLKFVLETQSRNRSSSTWAYLPPPKNSQHRCDQWLLRCPIHIGFSWVPGRHAAAGA